jgi:hypothetical protein
MRNSRRVPAAAWRLAWVVAWVSLAQPVFAAVVAASAPTAIAPPSEVAAAVATARLQGQGKLRYFGLLVYEARLWVGTGFAADRYENQTFALELQYAREFEGHAIAKRSIVEMRRSFSVEDAQAQTWQAAMVRAFPDVAPGDRLTGIHIPGAATRFFHNGQPTSAVADAQFARAFFGIWLAVTTSEPALRRQLIGAGS